jgi:acyl transferase domain-containing protein
MSARAPQRVVVVCPGRGSYGRAQLGSLGAAARTSPAAAAIVAELDAYRGRLGRAPLSGLDAAPEHVPRLHVAGEHASLLTFACTAVDLAALDPERVEVVGVTGSSLGFYTALYAAGCLSLAGAARLVETLGSYQAERVIGGQLIYPLAGDDWRPAPELRAAAAAALALPGVHASIHLGGSIVLGGDAAALARATAVLPPVARGGQRYPLPLPLHAAFHTPLMAEVGARARAELGSAAALGLAAPARTLIAGDGAAHRPWSDPDALFGYTLGAQIVAPYDLERAIRTALGELGPAALVLPGPGDNLGSALGQILIAAGWRGLRDRRDFAEAQASDRPLVLALARPDQRARAATSPRPDRDP